MEATGFSCDIQGHTLSPGVCSVVNSDFSRVKTLADLSLCHVSLNDFPVVKAWRDRLFDEVPEICDELPRLLTGYVRTPEAQSLPPEVRRARAVRHVFEHKKALVRASDLLPGQTTTSFVGPVIYMDTIGYCIWPELNTVATRRQNPFKISPDVAKRLNKEIFPFWLDRQLPVQEAARAAAYDTGDYPNKDEVNGDAIDPALKKRAGETPRCQELMERVAFYLSDKSTCVSHTVPDWDRLLKYGLDDLAAQMRRDLAVASNASSRQFLAGVIGTFEGAMTYAIHLAEAAEAAGNAELARICRKVPAQPADTLHEALSAIWICYHLLLQENTNFGLSLGRLDQLLNPYYLKEWQNLDSDGARNACTRHAVELVCHFFLRCSDHVPLSTSGSETLFAGSGSNQALTVGGTRYENGRVVDAVNDMTYIILKATELLSIRDPNVHARYHADVHHRDADGNPLPVQLMDAYLRRICQVNIATRATPALHGDIPVIKSMAAYYADHRGVSANEAMQDACDYASIGCIEQNAPGKHYGNSGSTLLVLPAVLELALFGGKHRSDGTGAEDPDLFNGQTNNTSIPLTEMTCMAEFISAFRLQLDQMARHAVQNNNYLGRFMGAARASPFLSGLFTGPVNLPGGQGAKFRDVAEGGAKYNSAGVAIIGLADVIDTFCILDELVFSGKVSAAELLSAMGSDFTVVNSASEPHDWPYYLEKMRRWVHPDETISLPALSAERLAEICTAIKHTVHYGAGVAQSGIFDNSLAVKYSRLLTRMIHDVFYAYRTHRGGRYLTGYWSMTNHAGFGMLTQATPNLRRAGQAFASGITPCPGIVKRDGTPVMALDHMLSVAAVDSDAVKNGYTYNLSLTTRGPTEMAADIELFARYMKSFTDNNGVLVQMCVSSIADLVAADKAASKEGEGALEALAPYKDLMIRVAGYSAYFVTLSPQMRTEIIARANFALKDGTEQHAVHSL
ncbi:MAG TPA: formate acetyltransferase [Gallionella sp.]|nr:MAG: formate acetyltransferase [Gallionellales bacterium GWA2_54_124]HCI52353.1 formate acetyltransferase [Gallionella sp.]